MNTDNKKMEWPEIKGKIKQKWNKFSDSDIDAFQGNFNLITEKLQTSHGYTKDKAEQELADFKSSLKPAATPSEKTNPN